MAITEIRRTIPQNIALNAEKFLLSTADWLPPTYSVLLLLSLALPSSYHTLKNIDRPAITESRNQAQADEAAQTIGYHLARTGETIAEIPIIGKRLIEENALPHKPPFESLNSREAKTAAHEIVKSIKFTDSQSTTLSWGGDEDETDPSPHLNLARKGIRKMFQTGVLSLEAAKLLLSDLEITLNNSGNQSENINGKKISVPTGENGLVFFVHELAHSLLSVKATNPNNLEEAQIAQAIRESFAQRANRLVSNTTAATQSCAGSEYTGNKGGSYKLSYDSGADYLTVLESKYPHLLGEMTQVYYDWYKAVNRNYKNGHGGNVDMPLNTFFTRLSDGFSKSGYDFPANEIKADFVRLTNYACTKNDDPLPVSRKYQLPFVKGVNILTPSRYTPDQ